MFTKPIKLVGSFFIVAVSLSFAVVASAQSSSDAKTHDGFYLRLSLGGQFAGLYRNVEAETEDRVVGYEGDSEVLGVGGTSEITLGGTPLTGLVLGGSILLGDIFNPEIERDGASDLELDSNLQFAMSGFTVDYYIDENSGFHFGGTVGVAVVGARLPKESLFEYIGGWGWAFALATGYDWWIANQWSLGVLGRFIFAGVVGEDTEEGIEAKEESGYLSFGLLFTAVYH